MGAPQRHQEKADALSNRMIRAAIEVHRTLGPGWFEAAYEERLCRELSILEIPFERQVAAPVFYKGVKLDCEYRLDLSVDGLGYSRNQSA